MAKYDPLGEYLKRLPLTINQVTLTFQKIEKIIGKDMEPSARVYFKSWDNTGSSTGAVRQNSWLDVHWRTVMVDMEHEQVKFQRSIDL